MYHNKLFADDGESCKAMPVSPFSVVFGAVIGGGGSHNLVMNFTLKP